VRQRGHATELARLPPREVGGRAEATGCVARRLLTTSST